MSNQEQCPNCGGYRVETVSKEENIKTREQFDDVRFGSEETWNGAGIVVGGAIIAMVGIGIMNSMDFYRDGIIIELLKLLGGGVLTLWGGWVVLKTFQKRFQHISSFNNNETIKHYYHTCWLCGYKWNRRANESLPKVTLRPDLIAAGGQRLEEARQAEIAHHVAQDILNRKP
ncbi:MAG: hypothetical protein AABZ00_03845 [Chloroflexota bacterium]